MKIKGCLDPGHGGTDRANRGPTGFVEADGNLDFCLLLKKELEATGAFEILLTRTTDKYVELRSRGRMAADFVAEFFLSWHSNAADDLTAGGTEVFYSVDLPGDRELAQALAKAIADTMGIKLRGNDKGAKTRESTSNPGEDYYGVIDEAQDRGVKHVFIIETAFHSNPKEEAMLKNGAMRAMVAKAVAKVLCDYFKVKGEVTVGTNIVGTPLATLAQAKEWAKNRGAHQRFIDIADIYWKYGKITNIRPDCLYAQAAKETNFGKYTGAVKPEMNNWAGIKIKNPVADRTEDHETFATPDDGVRGHFNHIAAYIGKTPVGVLHDRYFVVKALDWAGTIKYMEELSAKWAPNPSYGESIINDYLFSMKNTPISTSPVVEIPEEDKDASMIDIAKGVLILVMASLLVGAKTVLGLNVDKALEDIKNKVTGGK